MGNLFSKKTNECTENNLENLLTENKIIQGSDEIFHNYFNEIKKSYNKNYKENRNNQINISLSLDKRDFESIFTTKKNFQNKKQKFVYWKEYLVKFFNKKSQNGFKFADNLVM